MNATSINASDLGIIHNLLAINLEINVWSARRKLQPEAFGGAVLPPDELASLGSMKVCSPDALKVFGTLKTRAVTMLDRNGVRFLGGWAIAEALADEIVRELEEIKIEFERAKTEFLDNYDLAVQEWMDKHPDWAGVIADSSVSADYVRSRMGFRWQLYKVAMPEPVNSVTAENDITHGLRHEIESLGRTLFAETAKAATEAWQKCYAGKSEISHKALSPLRAIHHKLISLSFVEPHVAPIADLIHTALAEIPKRGYIQGANLIMLQGLVSLLRDPEALADHAKMVIAGHDPRNILAGFVSTEQQGEPETTSEEPEGTAPDLSVFTAVIDAETTGETPSAPPIVVPPLAAALKVDSMGLW